MKKVLILSVAPVPTSETKVVEGGGLRAWGLAKGLVSNGLDVTVSVPQNFAGNIDEYQGIKLKSWDLGERLIQQLEENDSIVILYSRGDLTRFVVENIKDNKQLVVDLYVPIYIEVSARNVNASKEDYMNYMHDLQDWNKAFTRGDIFLSAHEAQTLLYTGVMSALGRINPKSYFEKMLIEVPFGYSREPLEVKQQVFKGVRVGKDDFVVLWFGGLYPWFDIKNLVKAIAELNRKHPKIKLLIVGAKNPFNNHPDFIKQYQEIVQYVKDAGLLDKVIFFQDWVEYKDRLDWYKSADVLVNLNKLGEENKFSWRTRVVDFVWAELPIITNGGDPLSEKLLDNNAAMRIEDDSKAGIIKVLEKVYKKSNIIEELKKNLAMFKPNLYMDKVTKELSDMIKKGNKANDLEFQKEFFQAQIGEDKGDQKKSNFYVKLSNLKNSFRERGILQTVRRYINKLFGKL